MQRVVSRIGRLSLLNKQIVRGFSAAPATEKPAEEQVTSLSQIVDKFGGLYPVITLGAITAISKEWLPIDGNLMHGLVFPSAAMFVGLHAFDAIKPMVDEVMAEEEKAMKDAGELYLDSLRLLIRHYQTWTEAPRVVREYADEYVDLKKKMLTYYEMTARLEHRNAVEDKLKEILAREQQIQRAASANMAEGAITHLKALFAKPTAELEKECLEYAIGKINPFEASTVQSPVFREFNKSVSK